MKRRIDITIIFIFISLAWAMFFTFNFIRYKKINKEIAHYTENQGQIENIKFLERNVRSLEAKFQNISKQFFSTKSTSEFVAKLPKIAEMSGIKTLKIENLGVKIENDLEITELRITTSSMFSDVANFIDILERSKLPIQIASMKMFFKKNQLNTAMVICIYKKIIKE